MITLYFGETPYRFPNAWEELTAGQYLRLVELLGLFWTGALSMCDLRIAFFRHLAGLEHIRVPARARERFFDNLLTASRQFDFFFTLDYGNRIDHLSADVRKLLRKCPPDELLSDSAEIRYARTLEYEYRIDAVWVGNLLPTIRLKNDVLCGWTANLEGGALTTSLSSYQYAQGYDLLMAIGEGADRRAMALLVGLLYGVDTNDTARIEQIERLSDILLQAVVLNFQAFVTFIFTRTAFSVLWSADSDRPKRQERISMSDSLYGLCKDGYGNYEQVEKMPLLTYLGIMRAETIQAARSMATDDTTPEEIAGRMGLSVGQVKRMLC